MGRRVESVESSTVFYAYHGTETFSEVPSSGSETDYVFAGGLRVAKVTGSSIDYYHNDALGSTRLVTDSSKHPGIVFADNYLPFGQDNGTPTGSETYKFTGKPVSQTTGLYYYYHRWYDSTTGRFISADTAPGQLSTPQTFNKYVYTVDRPSSLVDPSGLDSCNLWGWNTWGGCANNAVHSFNRVVVQPATNYVNKNVVKPLIDNVVVPLVKNVVIPYYNDLVKTYNRLAEVGSQMWNGYQSFTKTVNDDYQSFYHSVNQDLQTFEHDVSHLRLTNPSQFLVGMLACGITAGFVATLVLAPEAAPMEVGAEEVATEGLLIDTASQMAWAHGAGETLGGILLSGSACVTLTAGSFSIE